MSPELVAAISASLRKVGGAYEYLAVIFEHQNGAK